MLELERLEAEASACTRCALAATRTNVVFGAGSPVADLVFVGEAPGRHEDAQGIPFVGAAGNLLNRLCSEVGIERDQVYICNILKCRPPGNRDPLPDEIETCTAFLDRQLELLDPLVVVTLGAFATRYLLGRNCGITSVRGRRFRWRNDSTLIPTFHPAAAIRSGGGPRLEDMREDFALVRLTVDTARRYREEQRGGATPDSDAAGPQVGAGADAEPEAAPDGEDVEQLELF